LITPVLRSAAPALLALIGALLIAWLASKPPQPLSSAADPGAFSSGRAMSDVREMAKAPRPAGSAENARVRAHLAARMRQIGMIVAEQSGPIPEQSAERLAKWGGDPATARVVNVIGMLPGRDRTKPALMLMAHHDSVWASPGAPDDAAGVAAALEIARALTVRGVPERDVVLLFTDAEEIGLERRRAVLRAGQPLARRIGAVINRKRGARAVRCSRRPRELPSGSGSIARMSPARLNPLAVFVYELIFTSTHGFTIPRDGLPGFNVAFMGRRTYPTHMATAEALEEGALQDMAVQAWTSSCPARLAREQPRRGTMRCSAMCSAVRHRLSAAGGCSCAGGGRAYRFAIVAYESARAWLVGPGRRRRSQLLRVAARGLLLTSAIYCVFHICVYIFLLGSVLFHVLFCLSLRTILSLSV
jgi:hypothetical protein